MPPYPRDRCVRSKKMLLKMREMGMIQAGN